MKYGLAIILFASSVAGAAVPITRDLPVPSADFAKQFIRVTEGKMPRGFACKAAFEKRPDSCILISPHWNFFNNQGTDPVHQVKIDSASLVSEIFESMNVPIGKYPGATQKEVVYVKYLSVKEGYGQETLLACALAVEEEVITESVCTFYSDFEIKVPNRSRVAQ